MNILLFGNSGQVGWELQRSLSALGTVTAISRDKGQQCGDFTDPQGVAETVRALKPDVIVNAAAYTAVDRAENEPEQAYLLNAETPGRIAEQAARLDAWLVHFSTDYVFDGSGDRPWAETDSAAPLSVYGRSKLKGEQRIQESGCRHLILRTSWVYAARSANFVRTMLRLARERERITVVDDQWGAPTGAELLADVTAHAIRHVQQHPQDGGLYHCTAAGVTTWYAYARYVLEEARRLQPSLDIKVAEIAPVPTSAFPTLARRPGNSRLSIAKLQATFGLLMPHWQLGVRRMLAEIL